MPLARGCLEDADIEYADYTSHYTIDAHDMPMPEDMSHFRREAERRRLRFVAGSVPSDGVRRVLEAGTGAGWMAEMLTARGFDVYPFDIGADSLKRASQRNHERDGALPFTLADIYRLPFSDGSFDAVTVSEVIEHLGSPLDALKELARVVRPGGWLIMSAPYRERIEYTLCVHCNQRTPVNAHLHSLDEDTVNRLFDESGWELDRLTPFVNRPAERFGFSGFTPFLPQWAWRFADAAFCQVLKRQSFMMARGRRHA